ncbi:MAG: hypothetical protein ACLGSH_19535 [Acidobacteriota bacterium]
MILERLASSWRRDEQSAVETVKHALSSERLLLESAIRGAQMGRDSIQDRRMAAIEKLWIGVLSLRADFSRVLLFYQILLPSEYDAEYKADRALAASIKDLSDQTNIAAIQRVDSVEQERPYLGETLWLKFFIYRAFLGRIGHLTIQGKSSGHFVDWTSDKGVRQIISNVLPAKTVESTLDGPVASVGIRHLSDVLERSILEEISLILSGKRSAVESFENAKELFEQVAKVSSR